MELIKEKAELRARLRFLGARNSFRKVGDKGWMLWNEIRAPVCLLHRPPKTLSSAAKVPSRRVNPALSTHIQPASSLTLSRT